VLHLSTQANTTSAEAVRFWETVGIKRVNLARELTLEEIRRIRAAVSAELEIFVHGAMCIAWSGRCLLSAALTGRSANRGSCTHPCRWSYSLVEETRPGEPLGIEEDARGTYLMNSRDLCLIEHLPALLAAGADSLKIEGRMKSRYYVAAVTRVYREALDRWLADPAGWRCDPRWVAELDAVSHRPYGTGFLLGEPGPQVHRGDSRYRRTHTFVGVVEEVFAEGRGRVGARNRFRPGDELELIGPRMRSATFRVGDVLKETGEHLAAAQPNARILMDLPPGARKGDLLRRSNLES
jgi:putative protease